MELHWNRTYYIVVYQDGGNQWNYYKWYYGTGNPYDRGKAYSSSWSSNWQEFGDNDFCFRTYAYKTGEEPDGTVERWAVLLGCLEIANGKITLYADQDAYDMRDRLIAHGWDPSHIKVLISPTKSQVKEAMEWLDSVDDGDDIDLVMWSSHGGYSEYLKEYVFGVFDGGVSGKSDMDPWLDQCEAKGICIIADTCHSEYAIDDLAQDGRVILTSSDKEHPACVSRRLQNSIFIYYLADSHDGAFQKKNLDKNDNGWISAEEAFPYAKEKTDIFACQNPQNPQIYDGYDGELDISYVG